MCLYETLHKDYLLPSSYTQKIACEIDNPQRPGAQHLAQPSVISSMTKESRKGQIHSMDTSCLNQVAVPWQQSKHCKSTILQGSISKMLKKRKEKRCLLYYLQPPFSGMLSYPWRLSSLRSHCWSGVGSTLPGTVPFG